MKQDSRTRWAITLIQHCWLLGTVAEHTLQYAESSCLNAWHIHFKDSGLLSGKTSLCPGAMASHKIVCCWCQAASQVYRKKQMFSNFVLFVQLICLDLTLSHICRLRAANIIRCEYKNKHVGSSCTAFFYTYEQLLRALQGPSLHTLPHQHYEPDTPPSGQQQGME